MSSDDIFQVSAELDELVAEAEQLESELGPDPSTALVPTGTDARSIKASMGSIHSAVAKKRAEVKEKAAELQALLDDKVRAANAVLVPLQKQMARLEEGIWSINLYLGREEEILQLQEGEPAPASEPIVIRQLVLAMDEECAVAADQGGIDAVSIEEFDRWLLEDPAHVDQVMPELKGVVALVPRWNPKEYDDPWKSDSVARMNKQTYLFVRNGDLLFRCWTDFVAGRHLVPTQDEFTLYFRAKDRFNPVTHEYEYRELAPGSMAWLDAEEKANARQRHYMRAGLILQGLVDRTTVFHPLPPARVDFLGEESYEAGVVKIITNAERQLGDGHEPFRVWQRRLNAELRPGMRIIGAFNRYDVDYHVWPEHADRPKAGVIYPIEERRDDGWLVIRYERTETRWRRTSKWKPGPYFEEFVPSRRASCSFSPGADYVLPYDLAEACEMEMYLRSRVDRHEYAVMFPILKAAIAAKRDEAKAEQPFRSMLAGVLARDNGVLVEEAALAVEELVPWWKLANKYHRPLVGTEDDNKKAVRMIVAEHKRRLATAGRRHDGALLEMLRGTHDDALFIGRKRDGTYVVFTPENERNVYARELIYGSKGQLKADKRWALVGSRISRFDELHRSERFDAWDVHASRTDHLTGPEIEAAARTLQEFVAQRRSYPPFVIQYHVKGSKPGHWTYTDETERFITFQVRDLDKVGGDADHLLTGHIEDVDLTDVEWEWKRKGDGFEFFSLGSWGPHWRDNKEGLPWEQGQGSIVFKDDKVIAEISEAYARVAELQAKQSELWDVAVGHVRHVESEWEARAEERERQKFLEDYQDLELWEGHKKSIGKKLAYPYRSRSTDSPLWPAVARLVEAGQVLDGISVAEALDRAKVMYGTECEDVPEDVLELTL